MGSRQPSSLAEGNRADNHRKKIYNSSPSVAVQMYVPSGKSKTLHLAAARKIVLVFRAFHLEKM
jgi:hypothetical protein